MVEQVQNMSQQYESLLVNRGSGFLCMCNCLVFCDLRVFVCTIIYVCYSIFEEHKYYKGIIIQMQYFCLEKWPFLFKIAIFHESYLHLLHFCYWRGDTLVLKFVWIKMTKLLCFIVNFKTNNFHFCTVLFFFFVVLVK